MAEWVGMLKKWTGHKITNNARQPFRMQWCKILFEICLKGEELLKKWIDFQRIDIFCHTSKVNQMLCTIMKNWIILVTFVLQNSGFFLNNVGI